MANLFCPFLPLRHPSREPLSSLGGRRADGLITTRPDAPVVICEGEKSADAAARIFPKSVATTSPGGANGADRSDWSVLRGRKVLVWPDDDAPGCAYARRVSTILAALDCEISVVDAAALARTAPGGGPREPTKDGWDAADAITEWPDLALRRAAYTCARPFDVAESTPAYISFGKYTMDTDGLHTEVKRGRRGNSFEIVRVSAPFEILGHGRDPHGRAWGRSIAKRRCGDLRATRGRRVANRPEPATRIC